MKITAAKMVNDVAQVKRQGNKVVNDLMKGLIYTKGKRMLRGIICYIIVNNNNNILHF